MHMHAKTSIHCWRKSRRQIIDIFLVLLRMIGSKGVLLR